MKIAYSDIRFNCFWEAIPLNYGPLEYLGLQLSSKDNKWPSLQFKISDRKIPDENIEPAVYLRGYNWHQSKTCSDGNKCIEKYSHPWFKQSSDGPHKQRQFLTTRYFASSVLRCPETRLEKIKLRKFYQFHKKKNSNSKPFSDPIPDMHTCRAGLEDLVRQCETRYKLHWDSVDEVFCEEKLGNFPSFSGIPIFGTSEENYIMKSPMTMFIIKSKTS